jgi:DNA-binding NarL/FixJ family response regulator
MNILLADDERIITDLISDLLSESSHRVDVTNNYSDVLELIAKTGYDLLLLDMFFPNQVGLELLAEIRKVAPKLPVMFLSSNFNPVLIRRAFDNGAIAYVTKNVSKVELLQAVETVLAGKKYICKNTSQLLIKDSIKDEISELSLKQKLTTREVEILKLVAEGLTANEIAEELFISQKTVETHKANIMEKFETNRIIKLVKIAFENNII